MGRPERDQARRHATSVLGNGLFKADHTEDALSVREAELSILRRVGASEQAMLVAQGNLASTYGELGQMEKALSVERDVYSGRLKFHGEQHPATLRAALNYASSLGSLKRYAEAKPLLLKTMPVARRVLGEGHRVTLKTRWTYASSLCEDPDATLDDLNEAVTTLEDARRIARRVFGGAHPITGGLGRDLIKARAALRARETPSPGSA